MRMLREIAKEVMGIIHKDQLEKRKTPNWVRTSLPYLEAMMYMSKVNEMYGAEYGDMIVLYFLNNAHNWRGEDARRIKAELNALVEEYNAVNHR